MARKASKKNAAALGNKANVAAIDRAVRNVMTSEGTGRQQALRDLLTDIRHYADSKALDFHAACDGSYQVYLEERQSGRECR